MVLFSLPYFMENQFPERVVTLTDIELKLLYSFVVRALWVNARLKELDNTYESENMDNHLMTVVKILRLEPEELDQVFQEIMETDE